MEQELWKKWIQSTVGEETVGDFEEKIKLSLEELRISQLERWKLYIPNSFIQ